MIKSCFILIGPINRVQAEKQVLSPQEIAERRAEERAAALRYEDTYLGRLSRSYYKGLAGLSSEDREQWEKEYGNLIQGKSNTEADEIFRNTVFKKFFAGAEEDWKKEAWSKKNEMTLQQRDDWFAKLAMSEDIDNKSDLAESSLLATDSYSLKYAVRSKLTDTAREEAKRYMDNRISGQTMSNFNQLKQASYEEQEQLLKWLDQHSGQLSQYYNYYKGTDKLELSRDQRLELVSKYLAAEQIGGSSIANRVLADTYQDTVAQKQSGWEKLFNMGAGLIDNFVGNVATAVGMLYGTVSNIWKDGPFMENVLDNKFTRWANNLTATNAWTTEEQEKLLAMGMSDNAILNSVDQENSLLSMNTFFELGQQAGFIVGSTALSKIITKTIGLGAKAALGLSKALGGGKAAARFIIGGKNALYAATPGIVGSVEGGMNAQNTKQTTLKSLEQQVSKKWDNVAKQEIASISDSHKLQMLAQAGVTIPNYEKNQNDEYNKQYWDNIDQLVLSTPQCRDTVLSKYQTQIDQDMKAVEDKANVAMYQDFAINSVINGIFNTTLKATMHSAPIQKRLAKLGIGKGNNIANSVNLTKGAEGWSAQVKRAGWKEMLKRKGREALGEGLEEYNQEISSAFSQGYAKNSMYQYLDHKYNNTAGGEAIETDWVEATAAGLAAAGESATSLQTIKAGLYGALSTFGPRINNYRGKTSEKLEGENWIQHRLRRSHIDFGVPSMFSGAETRHINSEREKIADKLNAFFSDRDLQNKLTNAKATASWMVEVSNAINNRNNKEARDNELGTLVSQVMTLNSLKGTEYYNAVMESLNQRANLNSEQLQDPESAESQVVNNFLQNNINRNLGMTTEQAVESIRDSASKLLDIKNQVEEATEQVDKIYGKEYDGDIKESLVFNRIVINDYKKRSKQLDEEINELSSAVIEQSAAPAQVSKRSKAIIAKYGNVANARKELVRLQEDKKKLKKNIKEIKREIKKAPTNTDKQRDAKNTLEQMLLYIESEYENTTKDISEIAQGEEEYIAGAPTEERDGRIQAKENIVLSAGEIITMDPISRATMLDPENASMYSQEQLEEIEKVRQIGIQKYQDFNEKIKDRGLIERDYQAAVEQQTRLLYDQKHLFRYAAKAKYEAKKRAFKNQHSSLLDESMSDDLYEFNRHLDQIYENGDRAEIDAVASLLEGNESFQKYLQGFNLALDITSELNSRNIFNTSAEYSTLSHMLKYLHAKGIDPITQREEAYQTITETYTDEDGNQRSALQDYLDALKVDQYELLQLGEAVSAFKLFMEKYDEIRTDNAVNNVEIVVDNPSVEPAAPPVTPDPVVNTEEEKKDIQDEDDNIEEKKEHELVKLAKEKQSSDIAEIINRLVTAVESWKSEYASEQEKQDILSNIENIINEELSSTNDLVTVLNQKANEIDILDENGQNNVAKLLRQLSIVANNVQAEIKAKKETQQNIFNDILKKKQRSTGNPDAGILDSSNVLYLLSTFPNSATSRFLKEHRVVEFLQSGYLNEHKQTTVMFINDEVLDQGIKQDMGDAYNDSYRSVIAVIEHENGTIEIDGKKYQVIATMPTSDKYGGINKTNSIRQLIGNQPSGQFIRDSEGNILKSSVTKVTAIPFQRGAVLGQYNNAVEIIRQWYSLSYPHLAKYSVEQLRAKELQILAKQFIEKVRYNKEKKIFQFEVSNLNGDKTWENIYIRNWAQIETNVKINGLYKTIFELFKEGHQKEALESHYRIKQAAEKLKNLIKQFNNTKQVTAEYQDGKLVPDAKSQSFLENYAQKIQYELNNALSLSQGYSYQIVAEDAGEQGMKFSLSVTNGIDTVKLLSFDGTTEINDEQVFKAIQSLLVDEEGNPRKVEIAGKTWDLTKPQVDYPKEGQPIANINAGIVNAFTSGTLGFNVDTVSYQPTMVKLRSPINNQSKVVTQDQAPPVPRISNQDNSTSAEEENSQEPSGSKPPIENTSKSKAEKIANNIVSASAQYVLPSEEAAENSASVDEDYDNNYYVNRTTRERRLRVTKLVESVDEYIEAKNAEDAQYGNSAEESMGILKAWSTPSTYIGNMMDRFLRGVFTDSITNDNIDQVADTYDVVTKEKLKEIYSKAQAIKQELENKGWTFVKGDVKAIGNVTITKSDGTTHEVGVAGTLDLLAYDAEGNFHIIDFKTARSIKGSKRIKYMKQLAMYKKLLEQQYGITVSTLSLFPIGVDYAAPKGGSRRATAEYTIDQNGKLLKDGQPFVLNNTDVQVGGISRYYELGLSPDKLLNTAIDWGTISEESRALIEGAILDNQAVQEGGAIMEDNSQDDGLGGIDINNIDILNDNDEFGLNALVDESIFQPVADEEGSNNNEEGGNNNQSPYEQAIQKSESMLSPRADIPQSLQWEYLANRVIDGEMLGEETAEEIRKHLESQGIYSNTWNKLNDDTMEHLIRCSLGSL